MDAIELLLWEEHLKMKSGILPEWKEKLSTLESIVFSDREEWMKFLQHPTILQSMFMNSGGMLLEHQAKMISKYLPEEVWKYVLPESPVGSPPLVNVLGLSTSHNMVHQLYHIARYAKKKDFERWTETKSFVEWGGGYGNFCRIVKQTNPHSTYTIIDLPLMLLLQKRYLSEVIGSDAVNIIGPGEQLEHGAINLVSSTYWKQVDIKAGTMISTWALSESPIDIQNEIAARNWFGSAKALFAFHQCGNHIPFMDESTNLKELLESNGALIDDIIVIPGKNFYAFK
jgi:hypothetical protein